MSDQASSVPTDEVFPPPHMRRPYLNEMTIPGHRLPTAAQLQYGYFHEKTREDAKTVEAKEEDNEPHPLRLLGVFIVAMLLLVTLLVVFFAKQSDSK